MTAEVGEIRELGFPPNESEHLGFNGGWVRVNQAWAYSSATVVTCPDTSRFTASQRVRFKQNAGTWQYAVITAVGASTLSIIPLSGSSLANETITEVWYSSDWAPLGVDTSLDYSGSATGDLRINYNATQPGYVLMDGTTIGDASSGASQRANADCEALFKYVWDNLSDLLAPVDGGRGVSAAADWAAHKKITLPDLTNADAAIDNENSGWFPIAEAWSYASGTTITVPAGAASRFQVGDKIQLNNTTTKYFYIIGVADTTLTVTGGSDYTVANAAITAIFLSRADRPFGFPEWFDWTPTTSASGSMTWATSIAITYARFKIQGLTCYIELWITGTTGGSASNELRFTLPIAAIANQHCCASVKVQDLTSHVCGWSYNVSTTVVACRGYASGNFGIGADRGILLNGFYEIAA